MKRISLIGVSMLALCGMWSCGKTVPEEIIQPQAMENLLYDYHLATTMSADLPYDENYKKQAYLAYVFQKHGVTEAEFDSSMVWYSRHSDEMNTIYQNLQKRMETTAELLKKQTVRSSGEVAVSLSGDTVDLWQDRTIYWLTSSTLTNKLTFDLKADTSFHERDKMVLEANFSFLPKGKHEGKVVMAMNLVFDNDSTQGISRVVEASGIQRLMLRPDSAFKYKSVSGFMYYAGKEHSSALISDIRLMRYRMHEENLPQQNDSVAVKADTLAQNDTLRRVKRQEITKR